MTRLIRSRPLVAYYVLACAISVTLGLLLNVSLMFGLLALFGPAAAALIVARTSEGRAGVTALRVAASRWRVHPLWYAAAVALPVAGFALGHVAYFLSGHAPLAVPGSLQPIALVLFVLVIGEEIGWRGYLLRTLLRRHSPAVSTAIVAVAWAAWHSPLYFVPGMPSYGGPFLAFVAWVVPTSVLLTWLWLATRSAWLTTVMHGAANLGASLVFPMTDSATLFLFSGLGMTVVAAALVITSWSPFTAPPARSAWRVGVAEAPAAVPGDTAA